MTLPHLLKLLLPLLVLPAQPLLARVALLCRSLEFVALRQSPLMLNAQIGDLLFERLDVRLGHPFLILEVLDMLSFDTQLLHVLHVTSVSFSRQLYGRLKEIGFEELLKRQPRSRHDLNQLEHPEEQIIDVQPAVIRLDMLPKEATHVVSPHESSVQLSRAA